jgi:large subunit ribosomal protein L14
MLQNESILRVADNSGAKRILVIRCLGGSKRRYSRIGDLVVATVKKTDANSEKVKKGQIVKALVVTTRRYFHRQNDTWIRFSENCAVIVEKKEDKKWLPIIVTRVFVPLLAEFSQWGHQKIFSLAPEVL